MTPSPCTSCGASIVFLVTPNGKSMPVDAGTVAPEDAAYDPVRHKSHFISCPSAGFHRRRK